MDYNSRNNMLKISTFLLATLIVSNPVAGEERADIDHASMLDSKEEKFCSDSDTRKKESPDYQDDDYYHNCLSQQEEKSDKALSGTVQKRIKEIRESPIYEKYDSMADNRKSLRPQIEKSFLKEQKLWENYRDSYCNTLTIGDITGDSGFVGNISCKINMNKRRMEEIFLMYNPSTTWGDDG